MINYFKSNNYPSSFTSYEEYLKVTKQKDCKESWIDWKVECCGMSYQEAYKASSDTYGWGYEPILK